MMSNSIIQQAIWQTGATAYGEDEGTGMRELRDADAVSG